MPAPPVDEVDLPATARIGRAGGPGRGLRVALVALAVGLVLALLKPWDLGADPTAVPGATASPATAAEAARPATPAPAWTDLAGAVSCLSDSIWMTVVDEVDGTGRATARTWTRVDPAPARDAADPSITPVRVYAAAVPRIGICVPLPDAGAESGATRADPGGAAAAALVVEAWFVRPDPAGTPTATPIELVVASGGRVTDRGVLYAAPPASGPGAPGAGGQGPIDPEVEWSEDDGAAARPGGWTSGAGPAAGWPPGRVVFRVLAPGADPAGDRWTWLAIDLRGPWTGPEAREGADASPGPGDQPTIEPPAVQPSSTP